MDRGRVEPGGVEPGGVESAGPRTVADVTEADWARLHDAAITMAARAYAPYSGYPVGAAACADTGRTVLGCNVENAAYGVTLCAECSLVSQLIGTGGGRLLALVCVNGVGDLILPCGRCRQLLWEHGGPDLLVATPGGRRSIAALLPDAFGPGDLAAVAAPGGRP